MNNTVAKKETISLADLALFLEVARQGSLTRAALQAGTTKSAVSKAIRRLELRLGCVLLERTTRRLIVTPAGELLCQRGQALLGDVDDLAQALEAQADGLAGPLCICAPPELGAWLLQTCFAPFLELHPRIRLALRLDYAYQDLFDPHLDLTFRVGAIVDDAMVARRVGQFRRVLVANRAIADSLAGKDLATVARTLPMLAFGDGESELALSREAEIATITVRSDRFSANTYPALLEAATQGLGIAVLPDFFVQRHVESGSVVRLFADWQSTDIPIYVIHRRASRRSRRAEALLSFIGPELVGLSELAAPLK
ncbi:LysR family transcriptional regulator [Mesorhizobium japonicum]|uniref:Transcriptional regulator n=1 Tax=Mesorhizobium japonicum (strain LMG 29417 / CECT 9101 / MAFF 303099) TaxID=266835 RepID=Q98FZ3_RHILO|nr:LysR family transcriptional regulator [Mesorhizobium japonicum]BAB50423.1 transcriptional regulator [Mesorhizobium japonicum MAFF 303099]